MTTSLKPNRVNVPTDRKTVEIASATTLLLLGCRFHNQSTITRALKRCGRSHYHEHSATRGVETEGVNHYVALHRLNGIHDDSNAALILLLKYLSVKKTRRN